MDSADNYVYEILLTYLVNLTCYLNSGLFCPFRPRESIESRIKGKKQGSRTSCIKLFTSVYTSVSSPADRDDNAVHVVRLSLSELF